MNWFEAILIFKPGPKEIFFVTPQLVMVLALAASLPVVITFWLCSKAHILSAQHRIEEALKKESVLKEMTARVVHDGRD